MDWSQCSRGRGAIDDIRTFGLSNCMKGVAPFIDVGNLEGARGDDVTLTVASESNSVTIPLSQRGQLTLRGMKSLT